MGQEGPEQRERENIKSGKAKMIARHYLPLMGKRALGKKEWCTPADGLLGEERSLVVK